MTTMPRVILSPWMTTRDQEERNKSLSLELLHMEELTAEVMMMKKSATGRLTAMIIHETRKISASVNFRFIEARNAPAPIPIITNHCPMVAIK